MVMEAARIPFNLRILAFLLLCLSAMASSRRSHPPGPFIPHDYTRFADVERLCRSVLSSAGELSVDADRARVVMQQLSLRNGDWSQDAGQAPLMPFLRGGAAPPPVAAGAPQQHEPVSLASFMLTHMDTAQRRGARPTALNVSGFLSLTITGDHCFPPAMEVQPRVSPDFVLRPGHTELRVAFEGVYAETKPSPVGNAVLPVRGSNSTRPWVLAGTKNGAGEGVLRPVVTAVGDIALVLRAMSDSAYFDAVRLVSMHSPLAGYKFRPAGEELDVAGCSGDQSSCDGDGDGDGCSGHLYNYRGASFCDILDQFVPDGYDVLDVLPDWRCNSTDEFCGQLGPFEAAVATGGRFSRSAVAVHDLRCEPMPGAAAARVSAVFRAVAPGEDPATAATRGGLSGATLSAEGVWLASTGRLCMVGCLGVRAEASSSSSSCHYRVSLHVATAVSITRRGIVVGEIASTSSSHSPPLTFQRIINPAQPSDRLGPFLYSYSKVEHAGEILRRREPSGFRDSFIARSLLSYPAAAGDDTMSLAILGSYLGLDFLRVPKLPFLPEWIDDPFQQFYLHILSTGPLVGSYFPASKPGYDTPAARTARSHGVEKHQVVNVSAYLMATSRRFSSWTVLSLEGVYNPENGRMYLIGCRNIDAPWRAASASRDLEDGMDCSIEVTVEYPPVTMRWLVSPAAKLHVASTRDAGDPLHFTGTELRSPMIRYRDQGDAVTEHTVERLLCIAMLSAAVAATVSQLRHVKSNPDVAPFVSLAMLGAQALGYGATLVTDARMLPAWPSHRHMSYRGYLRWDMDCSVKALALAALLLTARLAHKVRRARARSPRVPGDAAAALCTVGVHLCGLAAVLAAHWLRLRTAYGGASPAPEPRGDPTVRLRACAAVVERYAGVVREWFLLPQVIGNAVWRVNCKPLRKRYYAGVTAVWVLPHVYGYLRPPASVYAYPPEAQGDVMDFFAKGCDVVVPAVAVVLALAVYVQQRWNYKIVAWTILPEQNKVQHMS
ncbi:hypothetical protein ACP4OV_017902 [Aristida adscensionis]